MSTVRFMRGDPRPVVIPFALAKSAEPGDLLATVEADGNGYKASEQTWDTNLATTRAAFVVRFIGPATQGKDVNLPVRGMEGGFPLRILAHAGGVWAYPAPAAGTYRFGMLVGPAKAAGNALLDTTLEIVATQAQAVGYVVGGMGVNPAEIEVQMLSTVAPAARQ